MNQDCYRICNACDSARGGACDGAHCVGVVEVVIEMPTLLEECQRLMKEFKQARRLWWHRFLLDGIILNCLENYFDIVDKMNYALFFEILVFTSSFSWFGVTWSYGGKHWWKVPLQSWSG